MVISKLTKTILNQYELLILALIAGLFTPIVCYNKQIGLEEVPETKILDELNYVQAGYTFRKTGISTAWSNLDIYKKLADRSRKPIANFEDLMIKINRKEPQLSQVRNYDYPLYVVSEQDRGQGKEQILYVQPFLDHPILGSLIYSLGIGNDVDSFQDIHPQSYRKIAVYTSVITGILILLATYFMTRRIMPALISYFVYSTAPTFVLASRLALLENILIPFSLIFLILITLYRKQKRIIYLYLAGITSGLAFLTKEQGIFLTLAGLIYLTLHQIKLKQILKFILPAGITASIHYLYGLYLAPKLTWKLFADQASRSFFGPLNIISSFRGFHFENFPIGGFFIFGIISLILICQDFRKYQQLIITAGSYLFVFLFFGGANYAWYYLPFIPFLVIASGIKLGKLVRRPNLKLLSLYFILPFSSAMYWGYYSFQKRVDSNIYRLILFTFLGIYALLLFSEKIKEKKALPNWLRTLLRFKIHYFIWVAFITAVIYQTFKWNNQSIKYIVAHWDNLPEQFTLMPY